MQYNYQNNGFVAKLCVSGKILMFPIYDFFSLEKKSSMMINWPPFSFLAAEKYPKEKIGKANLANFLSLRHIIHLDFLYICFNM
jgi:hypothetical protein